MADRAAYEAAVAQLATGVQDLAAAVAANGDRTAVQIAALQAAKDAADQALADAQSTVPDADLSAIQTAMAGVQAAIDALNAGATPPTP